MNLKKTKLANGATKYETNVYDNTGSEIIFYYDSNEKKFTDGGYMFNELHIHYSNIYVAIKIAEKITQNYKCEFNKKTREFTCTSANEFNAYITFIQIATSISTLITTFNSQSFRDIPK